MQFLLALGGKRFRAPGDEPFFMLGWVLEDGKRKVDVIKEAIGPARARVDDSLAVLIELWNRL